MKEKFLLILFYSASGSVRNLAHAIADGAEEYDLKVKLSKLKNISIDMQDHIKNDNIVLENMKNDYSNSNMFLNGIVHDSILNKSEHRNCFTKCS